MNGRKEIIPQLITQRILEVLEESIRELGGCIIRGRNNQIPDSLCVERLEGVDTESVYIAMLKQKVTFDI